MFVPNACESLLENPTGEPVGLITPIAAPDYETVQCFPRRSCFTSIVTWAALQRVLGLRHHAVPTRLCSTDNTYTNRALLCARSAEMAGSSLPDTLDLKSLAAAFASGSSSPTRLLQALYPRLAATKGMFIYLTPLQQLLERAAELEAQPVSRRGPLWGVPFATKDNVDVAGMPTTAGCSAFQYMPEKTSPAVQALLDAGKAT